VTILTSRIFEAADKRLYTGTLFLDFMKAFQSVNHLLLLKKLSEAGIRGKVLEWIQSYLTDRQITVKQGSTISNFEKWEVGLPEGSNLGPLYFSVFINDLPDVIESVHCLAGMYADDATASATGSTRPEVEVRLNTVMCKIEEWSVRNKILVSVEKSEVMLFHPSNLEGFELDVKLHDKPIKQVTSFKYLGVWLDSKLNYNDHFEKVCKKMLSRIDMIARHKRFFDYKFLKIFSNSLVTSIADYCLPVWGQLCNAKIETLDRIMLKMIERNILHQTVKPETKWKVISQLNFLTTAERRDLYSLEFIFKHVFTTSTLTPSLHGIFDKRSTTTTRSLRRSCTLIVPRLKTVYGQSSFKYQATVLWNSLPNVIQSCESFAEFDRLLRCHIISKREDIYIYT
jgi:ribonuclease P/MRP protein subunit RPP40